MGENLSFNQDTNRWEPEDAPFIRLQFDINDTLQVRHPKHISLEGLRMTLYNHLIKCGMRQVEHLTENDTNRRVRKSVSFSTGFRKHVISTFIEAELNHEIRELISDHAIHLDAN
ncbi:MAG TPA: hypothetical protein VFG77_06345 [Nitrososphaeraceae archaeon]|nr:hypothetical protein [Nitrososphaeraceae archaeon]